MFSCKYYEILKNTYFEEHLQMVASDVSGLSRVNFLWIVLKWEKSENNFNTVLTVLGRHLSI